MSLQDTVGGVCIAIALLYAFRVFTWSAWRAINGSEEDQFWMKVSLVVAVILGAGWGLIGWTS